MCTVQLQPVKDDDQQFVEQVLIQLLQEIFHSVPTFLYCRLLNVIKCYIKCYKMLKYFEAWVIHYSQHLIISTCDVVIALPLHCRTCLCTCPILSRKLCLGSKYCLPIWHQGFHFIRHTFGCADTCKCKPLLITAVECNFTMYLVSNGNTLAKQFIEVIQFKDDWMLSVHFSWSRHAGPIHQDEATVLSKITQYAFMTQTFALPLRILVRQHLYPRGWH